MKTVQSGNRAFKRMFVLLFGVATLAAEMAFGSTKGDSWTTAESISPSESEQSISKTCVKQYSDDADWAYSTGYAVYYFKMTVPVGTPVILRLDASDIEKDGVQMIDDLQIVLADGTSDWRFMEVDDPNGGRMWAMSGEIDNGWGCWDPSDPDPSTFYICVYGNGTYTDNWSGSKVSSWIWDSEANGHGVPTVKMYYQKKEYETPGPALGTYDNPESLSAPAVVTNSIPSRAEPEWGAGYYFVVPLSAGVNYAFFTTSGTAKNPASITIPEPYDVVADVVWTDFPVSENNNGYSISVSKSGTYLFNIASADGTEASGGYCIIPGRLPAQHDYTDLSYGVANTFTPGLMKEPGSTYTDRVIDQCLFRFAVTNGHRYACWTDGAQSDLRMMVYNKGGRVLAESTGLGGGNRNTFATVTAEADGYLYVGVCERFGDGDEGTPSQKTCQITVADVETGGYVGDEFDPADASVEGATVLQPTVTADNSLSPLAGFADEGVHTLGLGDWSDTFLFPARAGFTYKVGVATNAAAAAGVVLKASVVRIKTDGTEEVVETAGSVEKASDAAKCLSFAAANDGLFAVRLSTATANGVDAPGLGYPEYTFHVVAYKSDAASYGTLTVVQKGLTDTTADMEATWGFAADTTSAYRYGMSVPAKGTISVSFSAVSGFSTPQQQSGSVPSGTTRVLTGVYNDARDPGDDTPAGANAIEVTHATNAVSGTLFARPTSGGADTNDWFVFTAQQGTYYHFRFDDVKIWGEYDDNPMALVLVVYDGQGESVELNELDDGTVYFGAAADGEYFVCVEESAGPCCGLQGDTEPADYSYRFSHWSVDVGTVCFAQDIVRVNATAAYAEVTLDRSSYEGAVAVELMTGGDGAVAGVDYEAASGTVSWTEGDRSAKTVRIPLIAPVEGVYKPEKSFYVRIVPAQGDGGNEDFMYDAIVSPPAAVKVVIGEHGTDTGVGTVGFTAWGAGRQAFGVYDVYPSITVAPYEPVRLWVGRTGGNTGAVLADVNVRRMYDRHLENFGVVAWSSGESSDKMVGVMLDASESDATDFVVSIEFESGDGLSSPTPGVTRVAVHVDKSLPSHSAEPDDPSAIYLAGGTFIGVLDNYEASFEKPSDRLAKVVFNGGSGALSAQVTISGATYTFTAAGYDPAEQGSGGLYRTATLACNSVSIGSRTGTATLELEVDNMMDSYLETRTPTGMAILSVALPASASADAETAVLSGGLFMDAIPSAYVAPVMSTMAGVYEFALADISEGTSGTLSAEIGADGAVAAEGVLPDGTAVSFVSTAYVGSTLRPCDFAIPLYAEVGGKTVGGTVYLYRQPNAACLETWVAQDETLFSGDSSAASYMFVSGGIENPYSGRYPHGEDWSADVMLYFDGNGNTSGNVPDAIASVSGLTEVVPEPAADFQKDGMAFLAWQDSNGALHDAGTDFLMPICDQTLSAVWTYPTDGFAAALDYDAGASKNVKIISDTALAWSVVEKSDATGGTALRSGAVSVGQTSRISVHVSGARTFAFDWAVSCNANYAYARFLVDGVEKGRISGVVSTEFQTMEVPLDGGDHIVAWEYAKTRQYASGSDCAWIDNLRFGTKRRITLDPNGGELEGDSVIWTIGSVALPTPTWNVYDFAGWYDEASNRVESTSDIVGLDAFLTAEWTDKAWHMSFDANGGVPAEIPDFAGIPGTEVVWPSGVTRGGYVLKGWSDGGKTWATNSVYVIGTDDVAFSAVWEMDYSSVFDHDVDGITFATSGDAEWTVEDATAQTPSSGTTCLRSGAFDNNVSGTSVLILTLDGSGTLTFDWAVSCNTRQQYAYASYAVDGVVKEQICGSDSSWRSVSLTFEDDTTHLVEFKYYRYRSMSYGLDRAWLDNVKWTPDSSKVTVTFDGNGGEPTETSRRVAIDAAVGELPSATLSGHRLIGWFTAAIGGEQISSYTVVQGNVTYYAQWAEVATRTVTFDANGGTISGSSAFELEDGTVVEWPAVTKDGYSLVGWNDGKKTWDVGETYTVDGADVAFTARWASPLAAAADCDSDAVTFSSNDWTVETGREASVGTTCLRSAAQAGNVVLTSLLTLTVEGAGTLTFDWAVSCNTRQQYAYASYAVDGVEKEQICGTDSSWRSVSLTFEDDTTHLVEFKYYRNRGYAAGSDCAWLDNVKWTPDVPPEYEFTVNWAADAGVLGAWYSIEDGDQNVEAVNGEAIAVPDGKKITVVGFADTNNWYYITGGTGTWSIAASTIVTAAKRDVSTPATAEEVGLSGAFADADVNVVSNVMSWAQANDKTVADVNAMTFGASGDPVGVDAEAYLLNCAPADVATEAAKFKVTSFSVDASGNISITPADGDAYGNGSIEVRYSSTPGGEYTTTKPSGAACFIKIYLVK